MRNTRLHNFPTPDTRGPNRAQRRADRRLERRARPHLDRLAAIVDESNPATAEVLAILERDAPTSDAAALALAHFRELQQSLARDEADR